MDSKDFQLLVALCEDARQSYRSLARRVSLSHPAVLERVRRLERRGILQGFWLQINPGIFGRHELLVSYEGDWTETHAKRALAVRDVAWVALKVDGDLTVQMWPRERSPSLDELNHAIGANPVAHFFAARRDPQRMSPIDWEIIDVLIDEPRIPFKDLLSRSGLSPKTVRKHLDIMVRNKTISIRPVLNASGDSGELVYTLSVFGKSKMNDLREIIGDAYLLNQFQEPPAKYLLCRGNDLGEVTAKTHAVEKLPGVRSVLITLNREQLFAKEFMHKLVSENDSRQKKSTDAGIRPEASGQNC